MQGKGNTTRKYHCLFILWEVPVGLHQLLELKAVPLSFQH